MITKNSENGYNELKICKKKFFSSNKFNFIATIITQVIVASLYISIAFLIMIAVEAMEYSDFDRIKVEAVFAVALLILYAIIGLVNRTFRNRFIKCGLSGFKEYIFRKILGKSIGDFSVASSGKIISAFYNDLGSIETNYLNGTVQIIYQMVMFLMALVAMLYINMFLAICIIVASLLPMIISIIFASKLVSKEKKTSDESESFVDQVKDLLNGFIIIKSFKAEKEVLTLFDKQNFMLEEAKKDRRDTNDTIIIAGELSTIIMVSVIFTVGQYLAYKDALSIGAVIAFVQLSNYVMQPIQKIIPLWSNRKAALALINKIANVVEDDAEVKKSVDEKEIVNSFNTSIVMKDITFSYDDEKMVLNNINMTFEKGKSYAIIGSSGCGKSTLVQLLLGYYDDYSGEVFFDETRLRNTNLDSLYDILSVIQQNVFLFDSSIKNNITMFKDFDKDILEKAITLAGLSDLIAEKGYEYNCGEGGRNLSGGEKQRISIARCLLRETPIIIMDEATAALDNTKGYEIENEILNIGRLTKIIVTHKLDEKIMRKYDEIIVLHNGEIAERGTFEQLMQLKQYFYSLYHVSICN